MYKIHGEIEGSAPIMFNRCADPLGTLGSGGRKKTREQLLKEAELKVHKNGHGLFFPAVGFKSCIINGCRFAGLKANKSALWPFMKATVFVEADLLFSVKKHDGIDEGFTFNKQMQMIPNFRPHLKEGWKTKFTLDILDDSLSADAVRKSVETAGLVVGLGSGRPAHGRFIVTKWSVE